MNYKLITLHAPLYIGFILFGAFPTFQSALVIMGGFGLIAFDVYREGIKDNELSKIKKDLDILKGQIEGIQISRSLGR